jgi:hypothetical protein
MNAEKPESSSSKILVVAGRSIELTQLHIVALYDPESGAVLHRHSVAVVKGGQDVSEDEAVRDTLARAKAFHARLEQDPVEIKKMATRGQSLFPIDKLKVAVSNNPQHLEMELEVDPKSGDLVEASATKNPPRGGQSRAAK